MCSRSILCTYSIIPFFFNQKNRYLYSCEKTLQWIRNPITTNITHLKRSNALQESIMNLFFFKQKPKNSEMQLHAQILKYQINLIALNNQDSQRGVLKVFCKKLTEMPKTLSCPTSFLLILFTIKYVQKCSKSSSLNIT